MLSNKVINDTFIISMFIIYQKLKFNGQSSASSPQLRESHDLVKIIYEFSITSLKTPLIFPLNN
jgi:hypothetical protein